MILACLKLGLIYSFYDPKSPDKRLKKIFSKCKPKFLLAETIPNFVNSDSAKNYLQCHLPNEDKVFKKLIKTYSRDDLKETRNVSSSNGAYIMFTSGSTGFPKGALISHSNLNNFINWTKDTFNIQPSDRSTNLNPLFFDNSVFDFYSSIFNGASLVIFQEEDLIHPKNLIKKIDSLRCTQWFSVPSLLIYVNTLKAFKVSNMKFMKKIIFGGEGYPKTKLKKLYELYSKRIKFHNVYGPTECTCMCSSYEIKDKDFKTLKGLPPLGKIADNFGYLILDDDKPVKDNKEGELCLLGPCVGKGYYNDRARTRKVFTQNPAHNLFQEKIYRTGDIVIKKNDRNLYFLSRKDNQIKHMGYRIELEEIESAANRLHYVNESVAFHGFINNISSIHLVVSISKAIDITVLKKDLRKFLPTYMIPSEITKTDFLLKNPNGKIDRKGIKKLYFN